MKTPKDFDDDHIRFGQGLCWSLVLSAVIVFCIYALAESFWETVRMLP